MRQVCYAIVGKTEMHFSESCISGSKEGLEEELEYAQEDSPDEDYQIVPLFTERV